ncbi:MAG TPA: bacillithiol system redox-active protein YtxJ [Ferruginibacter sp.]|jgi:bacillithiol system protein YtxJ|nr:bacillithiol system redox-active protein YtxJ [Ferruginibacter sp.]
MNWIDLSRADQLTEIKELSRTRPQVIFKHSTRCFISSIVKKRLESDEQPQGCDFYFLDLVRHRALSNKIAEEFKVVHESPQVLLIKKEECIYDESHEGIRMDEIIEMIGAK